MKKEVRPKTPEAAHQSEGIHIERNQRAAQIVQSLFSPCQKARCYPEKSIRHKFCTNKTNPDKFNHTKPTENTSNRDTDEKINSLGEVAWERIFNESELPHKTLWVD